MGEVLEVAKVLVEPTMKLLDMVGSAIGTAYKPRHKRKMADATAHEINVIADAMRNAADMPVMYNEDGVAINTEDFQRLMQRAGTRLALQETIKQHNIESVVDNAYELLKKEETCSGEPVEQGWITRFFDSVADVSDEDLQKLWGKVLAGEIKQPRSYSLRTLETLKNLSKYEAELFQKILPYIITANRNLILTSDTKILEKYGLTYEEMITLDECGLINSSALLSINQLVSNTEHIFLHNSSKLILVKGLNTDEVEISIGVFCLTRAGQELFNILNDISNDEYFYDFAEEIMKNNSKKVKVSIHQINFIEEDVINYEEKSFREFPEKTGGIQK